MAPFLSRHHYSDPLPTGNISDNFKIQQGDITIGVLK